MNAPGPVPKPRCVRRGQPATHASLVAALLAAAGCSGDTAAPTGSDIAFVSLTPATVAVFVGDTVAFDAVVTRLDGTVVSQPDLLWTTSDPAVATIDPSGSLVAASPGQVTVTASSGGVSGTAPAQVNPVARRDTHVRGTSLFPHQEEPHLVIDETGILYVGWKEMGYPGAAERVAFARSLDGGTTWSEASLMEPMSPAWLQSDPWLAVDASGTLFFARLEISLSPFRTRVVVSRSRDGGLSWEATGAVADTLDLDKETLYSDGAGSILVAYKQGPLLRLARSDDAGLTWSPLAVLPASGAGVTGPVLAARPDGAVFAAWWSRPDDNLWVAASNDRGQSWHGLRRLNPVAGSLRYLGDRPAFPAIVAAASGRVSLAWQDFSTGDWDVLLAHTDDDGATWSPPVRLNDSTLGHQFMPALAAGPDGFLHAAWYDSRTGNVNLVYARSADGGATWSTNVRVTSSETAIYHGRLGDYLGLAAGPEAEAFLVWTDRRSGVQNIYFSRSSRF